MLTDYFSEVNDHGTVFPVKDVNAVDWSSYAKTGAKNLAWYAKGVIATGNPGEYRFDTSYNGSSVIAKLEPNTNYTVTKASGQGDRFRVVVFKNMPSTTATTDALEVIPNDSSKTKDTFNSDVYGYAVFTYSVSGEIAQDTAQAMIRLASDSDDTYAPYAMTNKELTDAVTYSESACTNFVEGATVEGDINKICKFGKVVFMTLQLQSVTASAWSDIFSIPDGYRPKETLMVMAWSNNSNGFMPISIGASGGASPLSNLTSNKVRVSASWITA